MNDSVADEPERGGCLTVFLVFAIALNFLTAMYYILAGDSLTQAIPSLPGWTIPVLAVASLANVVFALGMWRWKRWGVYGFAITSIIAFFINLISVGLVTALFGLVGLAILAFLVRDVWPQME